MAANSCISLNDNLTPCGRPLGISVHDRIIVGKEGHATFKGLRLI
jgi:DNA repair protein RadC